MIRFFAVALLAASSAGAVTLTSPDFASGAPIPQAQIYTRCGGQNTSPALSWGGVPGDARSLALTMIDLSVTNDWSHWILLDIPTTTQGLAQNGTAGRGVKTNFGDNHYDGPCPPANTGVHQYEITIWVLKGATPAITDNEPADQVEAALKAASADHASIMGTAVPPAQPPGN